VVPRSRCRADTGDDPAANRQEACLCLLHPVGGAAGIVGTTRQNRTFTGRPGPSPPSTEETSDYILARPRPGCWSGRPPLGAPDDQSPCHAGPWRPLVRELSARFNGSKGAKGASPRPKVSREHVVNVPGAGLVHWSAGASFTTVTGLIGPRRGGTAAVGRLPAVRAVPRVPTEQSARLPPAGSDGPWGRRPRGRLGGRLAETTGCPARAGCEHRKSTGLTGSSRGEVLDLIRAEFPSLVAPSAAEGYPYLRARGRPTRGQPRRTPRLHVEDCDAADSAVSIESALLRPPGWRPSGV